MTTAADVLPGDSGVVVRPNPAFLPKVLSDFHLRQSIELQALPFPGEVDNAVQLAPTLCPVWALWEYILNTHDV